MQDAGGAGAPSVWVVPPDLFALAPSPPISPPMSQEQEQGSCPSGQEIASRKREFETMAKLTKQQRKDHAEAEAILTKERLSEDEREFVFRNWHEGAEFINGAAGAFFTPYDLAGDFA